MIFVTVGTHEQQFNRLVMCMDRWALDHQEEVIIQTGYSTYEPQNCRWEKLFTYKEMTDFVEKARIVITHGGPSSFITPLQMGKIPIVVPRQHGFNEHVNDHQLIFCRQVAERMGTIILVEDVDTLARVIEEYHDVSGKTNTFMQSNNPVFCDDMERIVDQMFTRKKA